VTGAASIIVGPLIGKLSDSVGKYAVFCGGSALAAVMVIIFTNLGPSPLWMVLIVNVLLMLCVGSRMISASALMSIVPDAPDRGAFMAVLTSIQQVAGGVASAAAGLIVVLTPSGALQHYDTTGYVVVGSMAIAVTLLYSIHRAVTAKLAAPVPERAPHAA
jgi:MFS family permease